MKHNYLTAFLVAILIGMQVAVTGCSFSYTIDWHGVTAVDNNTKSKGAK